MRIRSAVAATVLVVLAGQVANVQAEVVIETVTVGDPGNAGELSGEGAGGAGPNRIYHLDICPTAWRRRSPHCATHEGWPYTWATGSDRFNRLRVLRAAATLPKTGSRHTDAGVGGPPVLPGRWYVIAFLRVAALAGARLSLH